MVQVINRVIQIDKMYKKGEQFRKHQNIGDISIAEYANATNTKGNRLKKGTLINREITFDTLEKTFDDAGKQKRKNRNSKSVSEPVDDPNTVYADYPLDIWFLISRFIAPEDVVRFSLICQKTATVCLTANFWFNLYRRYYRHIENIPLRLQPDCMVRHGSLKSCVIRTLYYTYEPFSERLKSSRLKDDVNLKSMKCVGLWHFQHKNEWNFCFKLRRKLNVSGKNEEKLQKFKDIFFNSEDNCKILIITTNHFIPLPYLGADQCFLHSILKTLSSGFKSYKIKLTFGNYCQEITNSVIYDPIIKTLILDWWDPLYYVYLESINENHQELF